VLADTGRRRRGDRDGDLRTDRRAEAPLVDAAAPEKQVFTDVLAAYFDGKPDEATLARL